MRVDVIYRKSPAEMSEVEEGTIQMVLALLPSPEKGQNLQNYLSGLDAVMVSCTRALTKGGRLAIIIPTTIRRLEPSSPALMTGMILGKGLSMRGEIIWNKGTGAMPSSWGGWVSPSNPALWDIHEHILVFSKDSLRLEPRIPGSRPDISSVEFLEWSRSVWGVPYDGTSLPREIPKRLIKLYTYPGDIILDPFAGTGTIAAVASALDRHYIGYENDPEAYKRASGKLRGIQKGLF
ncbi:MAG: DNA-methyltransferase [candidate division WOR-3 bacterium]